MVILDEMSSGFMPVHQIVFWDISTWIKQTAIAIHRFLQPASGIWHKSVNLNYTVKDFNLVSCLHVKVVFESTLKLTGLLAQHWFVNHTWCSEVNWPVFIVCFFTFSTSKSSHVMNKGKEVRVCVCVGGVFITHSWETNSSYCLSPLASSPDQLWRSSGDHSSCWQSHYTCSSSSVVAYWLHGCM